MSRSIKHAPGQQQFTWMENTIQCVLDYQLHNSIMTITHTGVPTSVGGRGIAADLTEHALETARAQGWKVVPVCSYAAAYIRRHPQYQDLVA